MNNPFRKPGVFLFSWPSGLGGGDAKAERSLRLLKDDFGWTVMPNAVEEMGCRGGGRRCGGGNCVCGRGLGRLVCTGMCFCNTG